MESNIRAYVLLNSEKAIKCSASLAFYRPFSTSSIDSILNINRSQTCYCKKGTDWLKRWVIGSKGGWKLSTIF